MGVTKIYISMGVPFPLGTLNNIWFLTKPKNPTTKKTSIYILWIAILTPFLSSPYHSNLIIPTPHVSPFKHGLMTHSSSMKIVMKRLLLPSRKAYFVARYRFPPFFAVSPSLLRLDSPIQAATNPINNVKTCSLF